MVENFSKTWTATLMPHRSLSRLGFILLMAAIAAINFAGGMFFYSIGAWPVAGFMGLDVLLIWLAFKINFADANRHERIEISGSELVLEQVSNRHPPRIRRFAKSWVQVELLEDRERELIGSLYLRFHGKRTEIASFLGPHERQAFAQELRAALRA